MIFKKNNKIFLSLAFITIVFVISSTFYFLVSLKNNIEESSGRALLIAKTAAIGLSGEMIKQLHAVPEDVNTVAYNSIKNRLIKYLETDSDLHFTYIYLMRDSKLYFMADSEPPDSENYSPPGQEYGEASDEYKKPFMSKEAVITKPSTDRWGTWVSILVPVTNQETGEILAVFGMDYSAHAWSSKIVAIIVRSLIEIFGAFLLLLFFYFLFVSRIRILKSNERFDKLARQNKTVTWEVDEQGKFTFISDNVDDLAKYKPNEVIGKMYIYDFFVPEGKKEIKEQVVKLFKEKRVIYNFEQELLAKDGKRFWISVSGLPILNKKGELMGYRGNDTDITERKKAEIALEESKNRMESLISSMNDLIFVLDNDFVFQEYNQPISEKLLVKPEMFVGKNIKDIPFPKESLKIILEALSEARTTGKPQKTEYFVEIGDKKLWFDLNITPFLNVSKVQTGLTCVARDITERKQSELKLKQKSLEISAEKNKIETIVQGIGDGVFVIDKEFKIVLFNAAASEISGFDAKETLGKPYKEVLNFVLEKDGKVNDKFVMDAFATGKVQEMANHTVLYKKDKTTVAVADSAAPLKDENGDIFGCVVVFRDVTKEREVDRMKTEFISVASHQLKTPLAGIKWVSELLMGNEIATPCRKQKEYLKDIYFSNERMIKLVDDLLDISHIESGKKFIINKKKVDVVKILDEILNDNKQLAKDKKVRIEKCESSPSKLILNIDGDKIKQALTNLINNAIKYSKAGGKVEIKCDKRENERIFMVKDNGIGIPKNQQKKIFQKFFRADNAASQETDGTGLGLYIAKANIEAHGGKLWFESEEGKGTIFYFSIPI